MDADLEDDDDSIDLSDHDVVRLSAFALPPYLFTGLLGQPEEVDEPTVTNGSRQSSLEAVRDM